jgi:hypothetical protein
LEGKPDSKQYVIDFKDGSKWATDEYSFSESKATNSEIIKYISSKSGVPVSTFRAHGGKTGEELRKEQEKK